MLSRNTNQIYRSLFLDILSIVAAVFLSKWIRVNFPIGNQIDPNTWEYSILVEAILLYPLVFFVFSMYDPDRTPQGTQEIQTLVAACFISGLVLAGSIYFTERGVSRLLLVYFYIVHFTFAASWRSLTYLGRKISGAPNNERRKVLLIGGGEATQRALDYLADLSWAGVQVVGYLTNRDSIPSVDPTFSLLGGIENAPDLIKRLNVDDVLIVLPAEAYSSLQQLMTNISDLPCEIWLVPDYFSWLIYGSHVKNLAGMPMISLKAPALTGYQRMVKRSFDLLVASLSLVVTLPMMGIIWLAVRLDSPGPAIIKQRRIGENWHAFEMFKFRSMRQDAEQNWDNIVNKDEQGHILYKSRNDPRVTRVGNFIRRTSLDELPQLINVLKGEMSLVGPRPELPALVELYEPWQRKRFAVPQGMTGWWQINGRSDRPMHLHTELDLYYVQNYSILLDLLILYRTIWVVFIGKGAF